MFRSKLHKFGDIGITCLRPRHTYNRYVGQFYTVPCRRCAACRAAASSRIVSRLETLRENSKSCFFVTLTYSDDYVPRASFLNSKTAFVSHYDLYHHSYVDTRVSLGNALFNLSYLDSYLLKFGSYDTKGNFLDNFVHNVLCKKDLQLFFKRFRKRWNHALPTCNIKFKYFAIGEYGVQTRRPHYHAIIYCNASVRAAVVRDLVRLSWPFGRYDVQAVKSTASSYCASYLNAAGSLPAFLSNVRQFAPFKVCSNGEFFEMWPEQVERFVKSLLFKVPLLRSARCKDGYVLKPYSRSTRVQFFPVCPGFHTLGRDEKRASYLVFAAAVQEQGTEDPVFTLKCSKYGKEFYKDFHFSELYDVSKRWDSPFKKSSYCVSHYDFMSLYISRRVYLFSRRWHIDLVKYVDCIIDYYVGSPLGVDCYGNGLRSYSDAPCSELPNSSFALSLLRCQYSFMEENVHDLSDLCMYYRQYNSDRFDSFCYENDDYLKNGFVIQDFSFNDLLYVDTSFNDDVLSQLASFVGESAYKHKERNSYYRFSKHDSIL